jgi:hypothetical protein
MFEFHYVQESIVATKRDKFIFHYCILKTLNIFPELISVILNFEMHHMKKQLCYFIEDQKFLLSIMMIVGKTFKHIENKPFVVFEDTRVDERYNDIILSLCPNFDELHNFGLSLNTINNPMNMLAHITPTNMLYNLNHISYDIIKEFKNYYCIIYNMHIDNVDSMFDKGLLFLITDNQNIKTKSKHFSKLRYNL